MERGLPLAEREALREQIRERAFAAAEYRAARANVTLRCQNAGGDKHEHARCRGESSPSGGGCLCTCHDNAR